MDPKASKIWPTDKNYLNELVHEICVCNVRWTSLIINRKLDLNSISQTKTDVWLLWMFYDVPQ